MSDLTTRADSKAGADEMACRRRLARTVSQMTKVLSGYPELAERASDEARTDLERFGHLIEDLIATARELASVRALSLEGAMFVGATETSLSLFRHVQAELHAQLDYLTDAR